MSPPHWLMNSSRVSRFLPWKPTFIGRFSYSLTLESRMSAQWGTQCVNCGYGMEANDGSHMQRFQGDNTQKNVCADVLKISPMLPDLEFLRFCWQHLTKPRFHSMILSEIGSNRTSSPFFLCGCCSHFVGSKKTNNPAKNWIMGFKKLSEWIRSVASVTRSIHAQSNIVTGYLQFFMYLIKAQKLSNWLVNSQSARDFKWWPWLPPGHQSFPILPPTVPHLVKLLGFDHQKLGVISSKFNRSNPTFCG